MDFLFKIMKEGPVQKDNVKINKNKHHPAKRHSHKGHSHKEYSHKPLNRAKELTQTRKEISFLNGRKLASNIGCNDHVPVPIRKPVHGWPIEYMFRKGKTRNRHRMEPMALGSPPASPGTSPGLNPNFLPAFLMGDNQQTSTPQRTTNPSPSRNRSLSFRTPTSGQEQRTIHQRLFSQTQEQSSFNMNMSSANERAGPPAKGLFDTIDGREFASPVRQDSRPNYTSPIREDQRQSFGGQNFSRNLNDSLSRSYRKPNDNIESLWVTILGFPPHAASLVLAQFSQCGTIQDKKFPPEGNWVHIKYSSRHEVAKALSYNGKLISNSIMVGVIPCSINENKENSMNETIQITSPNRARSLTQPYMPNQSNGEVLSPQNVPQKSTGLVTKAMEYVFGW